MIVKQWMSRPAVTISPKAGLKTARTLMESGDIHALAVVDEGTLVGLLTDRHLRRAEASDATSLSAHELTHLLEKVAVSQVMQVDPVTVEFDATLAEAADLFLEHKTEAIPVMAGREHLAGMLTRSDLSRAFLTMTALGRRGVQFGIRLQDTPGRVMEIIAMVRDQGARLASLITTDSTDGGQTREAHVHMYQLNRDKLPGFLDQLRQKGTLLYHVDLRTGDRKLWDR